MMMVYWVALPWMQNPLEPQSRVLQLAIDNVPCWSEDWRLPINDDKCVYMALSKVDHQKFSINGVDSFSRIDRHEVPGFWLDNSHSFSQRHWLASKAAFYILNLIHRSSTHISTDNLPPRIRKPDRAQLLRDHELSRCVWRLDRRYFITSRGQLRPTQLCKSIESREGSEGLDKIVWGLPTSLTHAVY